MIKYTHPEMFYLFLPFIIIIILYLYKGRKLRIKLEGLGDNQLTKYLFNRVRFSRIRLKSGLKLLGIFFIILASTGPQIGMKLKELNRQGVDIIILIDTSFSMNATDVRPSRLDKAKYELGRMISQLNGDRVGLIAFAGSAHLHCPLTVDYSAAKLFLNMISTDLILNQGTDLSSAIQLALNHIQDKEDKYKLILLVSDGEDHQGEAIKIAKTARELGVIIHSMGVGTISGGPIPIIDKQGNRKEFKKNKNGQVVTSILNEYTLNEIASITRGKYVRVENQPNAILPILSEIQQMEKKDIKSHVFSEYEDRYQFFLLIGLLLFIIEYFISTRTLKEISWNGRFSRTS